MKKSPIVLATDYGLKERFVASLKGVIYSVDPELKVFDLSHEIDRFNVWEAAVMLADSIHFWPESTVFITIVDPGVGTSRKSLLAITNTGHTIITPDNGTLTFVNDLVGLKEIYEIDEVSQRLPGSEKFETFHGRDVYAYVGARIASGKLKPKNVGPELETILIKLKYLEPSKNEEGRIAGQVMKSEYPFGNISTNISTNMVEETGITPYDNNELKVLISKDEVKVFDQSLPYVKSFGQVNEDQPLVYPDSNGMIGLAVNKGSFSDQYGIHGGEIWKIYIENISKDS